MEGLLARLVESLRSIDTITLATVFAFVVTEVLLFVIATFLTMKALLLRRSVHIGKALADNNAAMALVYYDVFFALWFPILRHPYLVVALRLLVAVTTALAIRAFVDYYGGWRAVGREIRRSAIEWVRELVAAALGTTANERLLARTRRRKAPRLNEARMIAAYSSQPYIVRTK